MNAIFEKNIEALRVHQSHVFERLEKDLSSFRLNPFSKGSTKYILNQSPSLSFFIEEDGIRHSVIASDPQQDAVDTFKSTDLKFPQMVFVFGVGLGHLPAFFIKHRPSENHCCIVVEKDSYVFFHALAHTDFSESFAQSNIEWMISDQIPYHKNRLNTIFQLYTTVNRYVRVLSSSITLQRENAFYKELSEQVMYMRDYTTILSGDSVLDSFTGFQNVLENLPYSILNAGLKPWKNKFRGKTCISIAAGPSVNEHWDTIKKLAGKVPMIACDTLLKPLSDRGAEADFITALERVDIVTNFFKNIPVPQRSSLVGPTVLLRESFEAFQGSKVMFAPIYPYSGALGLDFMEIFAAGYSAGNLNINLAAYLGFENIIMVGHNLAYGYKTQQTHASGTIDPSREKPRTAEEMKREAKGVQQVRTQDGTDLVWTRLEWQQFRSQIESKIQDYPDRKFINTSLKGAHIAGSETMTLEEALSTYVKEDFDLLSVKDELCKAPSTDEVLERIHQVETASRQIIESIQKWHGASGALLKKLDRWEQKIQQKELEGKKVSLDFLNEAINEVLQLKVSAVNDDLTFHTSAIAIMQPTHIAFEREINQMPGTYKDNYLLKRDFLLRHKQGIGIWDKWLPKMCTSIDQMLVKMDELKVSLSKSKSSASS